MSGRPVYPGKSSMCPYMARDIHVSNRFIDGPGRAKVKRRLDGSACRY